MLSRSVVLLQPVSVAARNAFLFVISHEYCKMICWKRRSVFLAVLDNRSRFTRSKDLFVRSSGGVPTAKVVQFRLLMALNWL